MTRQQIEKEISRLRMLAPPEEIPYVGRHFLVLPNYIVSQFDGQIHWINSVQLMRLYGVKDHECLVVTDHRSDPCRATGKIRGQSIEGLLWLEPKEDGDYSLPDVLVDPCLFHRIDCVPIMNMCAIVLHKLTGYI